MGIIDGMKLNSQDASSILGHIWIFSRTSRTYTGWPDKATSQLALILYRPLDFFLSKERSLKQIKTNHGETMCIMDRMKLNSQDALGILGHIWIFSRTSRTYTGWPNKTTRQLALILYRLAIIDR